MVLGSTQSLTEKSIRNISWCVKAAGSCGCQPYHLHVLIVEIWEPLNFGTLRAYPGIVLTFN